MNDLKPGPLVVLGGAVVMLVSTFLPWIDIAGFTDNGLSTDAFGLLGILILVMAIVVGAIAAIWAFAPQVQLPERFVGYTQVQFVLVLGTASFLSTFGAQFRRFTGIGLLIAWVGAAVIIVGAILQMRETAAPPAPGGAPPAPPPAGGGDQPPGTF